MHRVWTLDAALPVGNDVVIDGDEASHAGVKRLHPGERVQLIDGRGGVADATVLALDALTRGTKRGGRDSLLRLRIDASERRTPSSPRIEVCTATPKGGRVDDMIDQLSQIGAAAWRPLETSRGVVDPRDSKLDRLSRIAREACKQCGRAWMLEIAPAVTISAAIAPGDGTMVLVADASGEPLTEPIRSASRVRLLIGPEGGWTPEELDLARRSGAKVVRFGPHVMRVETAAVAGASVLLSASV